MRGGGVDGCGFDRGKCCIVLLLANHTGVSLPLPSSPSQPRYLRCLTKRGMEIEREKYILSNFFDVKKDKCRFSPTRELYVVTQRFCMASADVYCSCCMLYANAYSKQQLSLKLQFLLLTIDQSAICNVKGVSCSDEPTEHYHLALQSALAPLSSVFWFLQPDCFG